MIALQPKLWPEAKRAFAPIDVEYLSCECRKYHSYVNGTKRFAGKNVFTPDRSARLLFDVPPLDGLDAVQTEINVIAGAPCSGKTSLLRALAQRGHQTQRETAELLLEEATARGVSAKSLRADAIAWQRGLLERDHDLFDNLADETPIFTDTSFIETLAFGRPAGLEEGPNLRPWLGQRRYRRGFFLHPLSNYHQSEVRLESDVVAAQISAAVEALYREYGYEPIRVRDMPLMARVAFIESHCQGQTSD